MILINKFNKKDIKENDVIIFEVGSDNDFSHIYQFEEFFKDLQKEIPENVSIMVLRKGDFLSVKSEKFMNDLGWYRKRGNDDKYSGKLVGTKI